MQGQKSAEHCRPIESVDGHLQSKWNKCHVFMVGGAIKLSGSTPVFSFANKLRIASFDAAMSHFNVEAVYEAAASLHLLCLTVPLRLL